MVRMTATAKAGEFQPSPRVTSVVNIGAVVPVAEEHETGTERSGRGLLWQAPNS